jgi:glycine betaine/proline transport system substrate-binding protein
VRKGYAAECGNVGTLLKNTKFSLESENQIMGLILDKKMKPAAAAQTWLKANASTWGNWMRNVKTFDGKDVTPAMIVK